MLQSCPKLTKWIVVNGVYVIAFACDVIMCYSTRKTRDLDWRDKNIHLILKYMYIPD